MMQPTIDEETFTISFERTIPVSRVEVFDAWTKPEEVTAWWDPNGVPLASCEIELRVGGTFRFVNQGHGGFAGTYVTIERPAKLVFDAAGAVGTVSLETVGNGTRMRVTIRCTSKTQLEQFVAMGIAKDTGRTLENLVRRLEKPAFLTP